MVSEPTVTVLATDEPEIMPNSAEREDRHLGRPAGVAAGDAEAMSRNSWPRPIARRQHAEQHEVEDVGRDHADRDAVDALAGQIEVVDERRPRRAGMLEQAREAAARTAHRP